EAIRAEQRQGTGSRGGAAIGRTKVRRSRRGRKWNHRSSTGGGANRGAGHWAEQQEAEEGHGPARSSRRRGGFEARLHRVVCRERPRRVTAVKSRLLCTSLPRSSSAVPWQLSVDGCGGIVL
ncbi:unnamed protein product, partial [Ectocarpus fasciculatus]